MCLGHTLLPRSLHFELPGDAIGDFQCKGGFADVLKYECHGHEVAVKALRVNAQALQEVTKMFYKEVITWKNLRHPNVLPLLGVVMTENKFAMISEWMTNGNINQFVRARRDANRFQLVTDVAEGLIHMHRNGMIHGDLKGENILIDQTGSARLADFGLLTITSDTTNITSSNSFLEGGTYLRMSPELLDPEKFNFKDNRPTKSSDCYALGMTVYEVLSGRLPFYHYEDCTSYFIIAKVLDGAHPQRPQGAEGTWFINAVWSILERCWATNPADRPKVKDVRRCMEKNARSWIPARQVTTGSATADSSGRGMLHEGGASSSEATLRLLPGLSLEGDANKIRYLLSLTIPQFPLATPWTRPLG
ncbi:kinase-like domain-containing protein [Thelephora terrestris]|uniref:Kinase-like domain-containing protein n=1 Tax=Thelephora terrestris TaxID=56493 RepID=A0A9P6H6V2_9AGAM|nr:kinase-like domain-containing protein [Thelephora terrestris]